MSTAYNDVLRGAWGSYARRPPHIPLRTVGVAQFARQAPLHPEVQKRPDAQRLDINQLQAAAQSSSYAGQPGMGSMAPSIKEATGSPWYGPEVI